MTAKPHPQHSLRVSLPAPIPTPLSPQGTGTGREEPCRTHLLSTLYPAPLHLFSPSWELLSGLNSSAELSLSRSVLRAGGYASSSGHGVLASTWLARKPRGFQSRAQQRSPSEEGARRLVRDQLACLWLPAFCSWSYLALSSVELWRSSENFFSH